MKDISQLLADLQTNKTTETQVFYAIRQDLADGKVQQAELIEHLQQLNKKKRIPQTLYLQLNQLIQSSNVATVFHSPSSEDETQLTDDMTQIATRIISDNDTTVLSSQILSPNANSETALIPQKTVYEKNKTLEVGTVIKDRFILKKVIGSGGMSVVFRALDLRKQEAKNQTPYVAIKVLGDTFKHHPLSLLALERETQKIQNLAHPNIITVYDFDRDGENIYMTMECLEGQSLDNVILKNKQGMMLNEALPIIQGMCQALIYAHSKNIIHSDFKPENVYYTTKKIIKVLDFGIARAKKHSENEPADPAFDAASLGALTPPYASLEMLNNQDPDPADDVYALACITYKLLAGKHPFNNLPADKAQKAGMQPVRLSTLNRRQWQTLLSALAFNRHNRIPSVEVFLDGIMPQKRNWRYTLIAGVIIAVALSGYLGTSMTEKNTVPSIKLTQEQKNKVQKHLETGELYYSLGYLATPPGDSALDQYEKVLAIDPGNKQAIDGKKQLVKQYQKLAAASLELQHIEESLQLLETALFIEPENLTLQLAKKKIEKLRNKK